MKRSWISLMVLAVGTLPSATPSIVAQTNPKPASLLPTVERIRAEYPTPMTQPQMGELLNRVAWEHRAEGWGILKKTAGFRCPAPQGVTVACDILVHAPTVWHYDVLINAGIESRPAWQDVGPCVIPGSGCEMSRFVAPIPVSLTPPANLRVVR
jgi:hypothetical protein